MALRIMSHARAGLEATRGTGVPPTRGIPFTEATHTQTFDHIAPEELRQSYFGHYTADVGTERNSFELSGIAGFWNLVWLANVHIKAVASGTGAGADKTWAFVPTSATDDLRTATIEYGYADNIGATRPAWSVAGCIGDTLALNFDKSPGQSGVTFRSTLLSFKAAAQISAFTGAGTYTAENGGLVKASATQVYIDSATIGTTADNDVLSVNWELQSGPQILYTLNNSTAGVEIVRPNPWSWTARIRRYYRNNTELNARTAGTVRKIRVRTLGPVLGASNYRLDLDLYGKYSARTLSTADGLGVEEFTLSPVYDATAATHFSLTLINDQASIT